mmetsp:Transcript_20247/g.63640  ORF Transcript_20247/g.63640 Transcript_20247/m.63640 type:complete len:93 (+) Transcript_20247:85-363(+)
MKFHETTSTWSVDKSMTSGDQLWPLWSCRNVHRLERWHCTCEAIPALGAVLRVEEGIQARFWAAQERKERLCEELMVIKDDDEAKAAHRCLQ